MAEHWHLRYWKGFLVFSAVLMLVTVALAIYYAPLPPCSVKSANELPDSIDGTRVTVVGFVAGMESRGSSMIADSAFGYVLTIADFTDYSRYLEAIRSGHVYDQWWTIQPIGAWISKADWTEGGTYLEVHTGSNVSVSGEIETGIVQPVSNLTGVVLVSHSETDIFEIGSPGAVGVATAPLAQKIFYFHMPSAWVSYVGFFVTLVFSVLYLRGRKRIYDRIAFSSAELGVLFATIAIMTGPIWAKQEWGVYWRWDDTKLVTTFVMWLVYIGYLMLRAAVVDSSARARVSAVYGILGFVTMPMSLLSARIAPLIRSSHPEVIASSTGSISPEAGLTVGIAVVAFTLLFITMLIKRVEIEESEEELEELKRSIGGEE